MKVCCKNCKKKFDNDLYGGVCPKCGTYYRETRQEQEDAFSMISGNYNVSEEKEPTQKEKTFKEESTEEVGPVDTYAKTRAIKGKHYGKAYYTVTAVILLCMIMAGAFASLYVTRKNEAGKQQMELQSLPEPEIIRKGDAFTYERTNQDGEDEVYSISITKAQRMKSKKLNVPEGYEMVEISYHVENAAWEGDDYEEYGMTRSFSIPVHPYLVTKSGEYVKPVPAYSIAEMMNWDYEREEAEGLSDGFTYEDGVISYLVKENDMEALWISQHEYDAENFREMGLVKSILIKDLGE